MFYGRLTPNRSFLFEVVMYRMKQNVIVNNIMYRMKQNVIVNNIMYRMKQNVIVNNIMYKRGTVHDHLPDAALRFAELIESQHVASEREIKVEPTYETTADDTPRPRRGRKAKNAGK